MKLLSIDCSTPILSAALLQKNNPTDQEQIEHQAPEPNPVLKMVDSVLKRSGQEISGLDGFVLTVGPGSFTGLRIGLSLVKGFVLATEKPVVGIGTLEAWAARLAPSDLPVCCLLDARKGQVYYSRFRRQGGGLIPLGEAGVMAPDALAAMIQEPTIFTGTGIQRYGNIFKQRLQQSYLEGETIQGLTAAGAAGMLATEQFDQKRVFDLNGLHLQYIRRPEAERNFKQENTVI